MEYINTRAPALLAFFTGARQMYHSSRSPRSGSYNRCHKDSQLYYQRNKERGDNLAPDIRRCGKSSCEKRKNHQKTTIVRGGFYRKTPWFWQTDHNYRYLGAYRWNERNTNS
ncbi:hypothetical protein KY289_037660 [Solanum tuberosum]|nr:hypothetical protein KY289_037660 [Solanum tuberosum]